MNSYHEIDNEISHCQPYSVEVRDNSLGNDKKY